MFEKISRMAEAAATNVSVSRRGFLGRLGQSALGVAAVLAGMNAVTAQSGGVVCCKYHCPSYSYNPYKKGGPSKVVFTTCLPAGSTCNSYGCTVNQHNASSCDKC